MDFYSRHQVEYVEAYEDEDEEEEVIMMYDEDEEEKHNNGMQINGNLFIQQTESPEEEKGSTNDNSGSGDNKSGDGNHNSNSTGNSNDKSGSNSNSKSTENDTGSGDTGSGDTNNKSKSSSRSTSSSTLILSTSTNGTVGIRSNLGESIMSNMSMSILSTCGRATGSGTDKSLMFVNDHYYYEEKKDTIISAGLSDEDDDFAEAHDDYTQFEVIDDHNDVNININTDAVQNSNNNNNNSNRVVLDNNEHLDSELSDLDFTLLGDPTIQFVQSESLISFYEKDREFSLSNDKDLYNNNKIRILSWNILADGQNYALSSRHRYTPIAFRDWSYRSKRIFASLDAYKPDIICLQETTGKMYRENFLPKYNKSTGYDSIHCELARDKSQSDTIIFRVPRFKLLNQKIIKLAKIEDGNDDESVLGPINNMFRSFFQQQTEHAIICHFEDTESLNLDSNEFIVVSSHLFWDPDRPHIKSAQMFLLNRHIINLLS